MDDYSGYVCFDVNMERMSRYRNIMDEYSQLYGAFCGVEDEGSC